jgi:dihydroorotate dehydrogenase (fumarate)
MASLKTSYMGIELKNPVIAGASSMTMNLGSIKKIEDAGAGALVIASLFEEQIQLEQLKLEEELEKIKYRNPEMIEIFPDLEHAGPQEHLMWVRKAKESVDIPVIASLNAINRETWTEYALLLEETRVDGLELNFFATPSDFDRSGSDLENAQVSILKEVMAKVKIPISVKLSIYYSNPLHFIKKLDTIGVDGFVLFNRFFQPDIDIDGGKNISPFNFSHKTDYRLPLRYAGLLFGNIKGSICSSRGIQHGRDVLKMILAGADCIQCVSTLFLHKVDYIKTMLSDMERWMDGKGYADLAAFRGKMSRKNSSDPWAYTRAQYVKMLVKPEQFLKDAKTI